MGDSKTRDPAGLERFVQAQQPVWEQVCSELRAGRKSSHWMWFVFPQLKGLGHSTTAQYYGISSLDEAKAYLSHPVLGERLRESCRLVNRIQGRSIEDIFGYPDDLKFRSCMTLFARATPDNKIFLTALERFFDGEPDPATVERLQGAEGA